MIPKVISLGVPCMSLHSPSGKEWSTFSDTQIDSALENAAKWRKKTAVGATAYGAPDDTKAAEPSRLDMFKPLLWSQTLMMKLIKVCGIFILNAYSMVNSQI